METIIIIAALYIVPLLLMRRYFIIAYSEDGIWWTEKPTRKDLVMTFTPVGNIVALFAWIDMYPVDTSNKNRNSFRNKFFKIKNN